MSKLLNIITLSLWTVASLGQTNLETNYRKIITDSTCKSNVNPSFEKDVKLDYLKFSEYFNENYTDVFPSVAIEFNIIMEQNSEPCCKTVIIYDSTKVTDTQIGKLKSCMMAYPQLKNCVSFQTNETIKYLSLILTKDKNKGKLRVDGDNLMEIGGK
jgi:hypothetical protein